jgi:hypothetical protein
MMPIDHSKVDEEPAVHNPEEAMEAVKDPPAP